MATERGTDTDDVLDLFDPGDENEARQDAAVEVALDIAAGFVDERLDGVGYDADKLARFEQLLAAHVLHAPYPHEDSAEQGDASATFAGADLGGDMGELDPDGLAETRYGRLVLTYDTDDVLTSKNDVFRAFGPENPKTRHR